MITLRSVIMGERTPVQNQREIFDRIRDTNIALSLAAVGHAGYEFREERIKFGVPVSKMMPMISPRTAHIFCHQKGPFGELTCWMVERHPLSKVVNRPV